MNTQDPNIQFTVEEPDQDGSLPFLDTKVTPGPTALSTPQFTESQHTQINIYTGTAATL